MNTIHPVLKTVTDRITERSRRAAYLPPTREAEGRGPARGRLACANLAAQFPRLPGSAPTLLAWWPRAVGWASPSSQP